MREKLGVFLDEDLNSFQGISAERRYWRDLSMLLLLEAERRV